jgi:tetratricopeptide (TPR) repeat protein
MRKSLAYPILGVALVAGGVLAIWLVVFRQPPLRIDEVLAAYEEGRAYGGLTITYPLDHTLFPPEIPAPRFRWQDGEADSDTWLVTIRFPDGHQRMSFVTRDPQWTPSDDHWEAVKRRSREREATVTVLGLNRSRPTHILSGASISISTSADEVGAPLFYREVDLPFKDAVADPAAHIRWRFGPISSREQPPVVLEKLPVCGNCHSFTRDGDWIGMDVDYANDKGSYAICPVSEEIALDNRKIITWSDYRRDDEETTFGLLSQISPDGRYVVSTVKDRSVFVAKEDLAFSQLFFPIKGILAVYDRRTKSFRALPGADDKRFVQSNPTWSPDGKHIVFARSEVHHLKNIRDEGSALLTPEDCPEFLRDGKTFQFDLYRIPFNEGRGGKAEPLAGASQNGVSNYFPKYSPDGRWIVFCRARSFMLLQPDSELFIIPAEGGEARRLRCNTARMNSWHSWSPNGRWLVFSSKARSPYTQLFLTHIDAQGQSSPPVELERFTTSKTAANIPEFVNSAPGAIRRIRQQFLDGDSYYRAGQYALLFDDFDTAEHAYRMALKLDPKHELSHNELGVVLTGKNMFDEAEVHFLKAIELDPEFAQAHRNLGTARGRQGKFQEAVAPLREALRIRPDDIECHRMLGNTLLGLGRLQEGQAHLDMAKRLNPKHADARASLDLADGFTEAGKLDQAALHFRRALEKDPDSLPALLGLASLLATAQHEDLRDGKEAVAHAERACALTRYTDPAALGVLAAAYAETGEFGTAVYFAEQALQCARREGEEILAASLEQQLGRYRKDQPVRRP